MAPVAIAEPLEPGQPSTISIPWVEFSGLPGSESSSFGARALVPLSGGERHLFFLGLDGAVYDSDFSDIFQGDFGRVWNTGAYLGFRSYVANDWIVGAWLGADAQNTLVDNTFGRLIGGLETYNSDWVLRFSGFTPFDDGKSINLASVDHPAAAAIRSALLGGFELDEESPSGLDLEAGIRLPFDLLRNGGNLDEVRLTFGGFHYFGVAGGDDLTGGRVRGEIDLYPFDGWRNGTRLTLEAEVEHDRYRDQRYAGGLRLAIPLSDATRASLPGAISPHRSTVGGPGDAGYQAPIISNLVRPVRRDQDVVTSVGGDGNEFLVTNTEVEVIKVAPIPRAPRAPGGPAVLTLSVVHSPAVLQGPFPFAASFTFTVTNSGNGAATSLVGSEFAGAAASGGFVGGTYPGTGGTCGVTLAQGASCQVELQYTFTLPGNYNVTFGLAYFDGTANQSVQQDVPVMVTF